MKKLTKPIALCSIIISISTSLIAKENVYSTGINTTNTSNNQTRELQFNCAPATAQSDLDINNVRAKILGGGDMWWDLQSGGYFIPKPADGTRGVSSMYAASLWIGGYDSGGNLKVAAQTYRQSGNDFWPGPLSVSNFTTDASTCLAWDKQFKVNKEDVEKMVNNPTAPIPYSILNWPTMSTDGQHMAPYYDADGNGMYDPSSGDYPDFWLGAGTRPIGTTACDVGLYGDQAIWWVFNDKGNAHTASGAGSVGQIGLEIHAQGFGFKTNDEINNMTFYKYKIINRSQFDLDSTFFGVWCDSDVGAFNDDYVGCDVEAGLGYSYNGDLIDGPSGQGELVYGANPPAIGIDFFEGPYADADGIDNSPLTVPGSYTNYGDGIVDNERLGMSRFIYYNNDWNPVNGNPGTQTAPSPVNIYQYLSGSWKNGQLVTYGGDGTSGSVVCKYMFPGDSDPKGWGTGGVPQSAWSEAKPTEPGDRRFLQSAGPFTLKAGATNTITIGVPWARATQGGNLASISLLKGADAKAQDLFKNCFKTLDGPTAPELTIQELDRELILYWTNPASSNNYNENYTEDYDLSSNVDVPYTFQGYMIYQLKDAFVSATDLYDVDKARLVFQCDKTDGVLQIVNYYNDPSISALVPQEMVNGENKGVVHSLKITEDKFAIGNASLVNHKTYYYTIVAYGYSKTKDAPDFSVKKDYLPFIAGRKQADGKFVHTAIPHIVTPEMEGTEQHAVYGNGVKIKRIEGQGNGGNVLELTEETVNTILNSPDNRVKEPIYEAGRGPINISVIDPLNVPENNAFRFVLKPKYPVTTSASTPWGFLFVPQDSSRWELENMTTGEIVKSDKTIKYANEQIINGQTTGSTGIIPKWGLSVNVKFVVNPGPTFDSITPGSNPVTVNLFETKNAFLEASMTFSDPGKKWLTGVSDEDGESQLNWIRSGTKAPQQATAFDDLKGLDDEENYESVLNGTWAPYALTVHSQTSSNSGPYKAGAAHQDSYTDAVIKMGNTASIDVVITSDKNKWTRCPVIEMQENTTLAIGGAVKLNRRKSPSVDKNGLDINDAGYNAAEGDFNGAQPIGMGWFPGYAINVETGERLNMAFGEDSWLTGENGSDMIWNPTSAVMGPGDEPLFGGKHYIYVFGHNGHDKYAPSNISLPNGLSDVPRYDNAVALHALFTAAETPGSSASYKLDIYRDAMWVNIPLLASGHTILESDVKIRLRVARQYNKAYSEKFKYISNTIVFSSDSSLTPINNNYPVYEFNTNDIGTTLYDKDIAKDAMKLINVVPNPYYAYSEYEQKTLDNIVKITNLPEKCKISIYTLNGNLVKVYNKDDTKTSLDWDLKNHKRIPIASGLYIIHVDAPGLGERTLKWFGVMRPIDLESF